MYSIGSIFSGNNASWGNDKKGNPVLKGGTQQEYINLAKAMASMPEAKYSEEQEKLPNINDLQAKLNALLDQKQNLTQQSSSDISESIVHENYKKSFSISRQIEQIYNQIINLKQELQSLK